MRVFSIIFCLLIISLHCDARKRRKTSNKLAEKERENIGGRQSLAIDASNTTRWSVEITSMLETTPISSPSAVKEDILSTTSASKTKRKRKSKRNRKGKKARKDKKGKKRKQKDNKKNLPKSAFDTSDESQRELLRSTMRHMFGFDHMAAPRETLDIPQTTNPPVDSISSTTASENAGFSSSRHQLNDGMHRAPPNPPDFMLELYRTYSEDKSLMQINAQSQGNTIRSFFSVAGEAPNRPRDKGKPMIIIPYFKASRDQTRPIGHPASSAIATRQKIRVFAFNVSSIPSSESIVAAELRLDRLRHAEITEQLRNVSRSQWSADISVYKVADSAQKENGTRNVYQRVGRLINLRPSTSFAWADGHIARLASRARQPGHVLIVKFNRNEGGLLRRKRSSPTATNNLSYFSSLAAENTASGLPTYFVVMGTDRRKRNSGVNHRNRDFPSLSNSNSLTPFLIVYCNDTKTLVSKAASPVTNGIWSTIGNFSSPTKTKRTKRSSNRRLPDDPMSPASGGNELPGETSLDEQNTGTAKSFSRIGENDQTELHDDGKSERRVMQQLKDRKALSKSKKGKKRKRGRKCKKRGRKGRKSKKCKKEQLTPTPEAELNRPQQVCSRKSLHVDFGDIGWEEWIISPKHFDAYYCSGLCEFKTLKETSPSNHAIIQAFIKSFDINPEVPAPCCVPENLMSLTVLFFDQDDNVVLKVYPNMSVETCACR